MAWNEDGWRLARETHDATRRAVETVGLAGIELNRTNPELAAKLERAFGTQGRALSRAGSAAANNPSGELPTTEPEARRVIAACQRWKALFIQLDSEIATAARAGRHGLTLADHGEIQRLGWVAAHDLIVTVPWSEVHQLMQTPQAAPRAPAAPRDPSRPRQRSGMQGLLPLAFLLIVVMSSNRR